MHLHTEVFGKPQYFTGHSDHAKSRRHLPLRPCPQVHAWSQDDRDITWLYTSWTVGNGGSVELVLLLGEAGRMPGLVALKVILA